MHAPSVHPVANPALTSRTPPKAMRNPCSARRIAWRAFVRGCAGLAVIAGLAAASRLAARELQPGAAPHLTEVGSPAFTVSGRAELGLASHPTDIQLLPDGRVLVVAGRQLAFGDGARWNTFQQAPDQASGPRRSVAVAADGQIYAGMVGAIGRVGFEPSGHWRLVPEASLAASTGPRHAPREVEVVGDTWYWHGGSGSIHRWRRGEDPTMLGSTGAPEHVFALRGQHFLTDRSDGWIFRVDGGHFEPVQPPDAFTPSLAVTCSTPLSDDAVLVGTHARGLMVFDGTSLKPWVAAAPLAGSARINDVCRVNDDLFAAAVDRVGLVFFDSSGRVRQVVGRSLDARIARIHKLIAGRDGCVWGLLSDGIIRSETPTRFSNFDLLIGSSVNTAFPVRHEGRLWLLADGVVLRGAYDEDGRLDHLEHDTPEGRFVFALSSEMGMLAAGTEAGLYLRGPQGWRNVAPQLVNARILEPHARDGRWLYAARGEIGWIAPAGGTGVALQRFPVSGIVDVYGCETGSDGVPWVELGTGRLGRIEVRPDGLKLEVFGRDEGVPNSWAQVFEVDGIVRFNVAESILVHDRAIRRIVPDVAFLERLPGIREIVGRPRRDAAGRLWLATQERLLVLDDRSRPAVILDERPPHGIVPVYLTAEDAGVVWIHDQHRLIRYDPGMPQPTPPQPRALITHVGLPESGRILYPAGGSIGPLSHTDHSLVFNFLSPGDPVGSPASFEVRLEGADEAWTQAGPRGAAVFTRLREGAYRFQVRATTAGWTGPEASLAFVLQPPWHRTTLAYAGYALIALVVLLASAAGWSYLARRERQRLEVLVGERTAELSQSEERYRRLNEELEQRVHARTGELDRANHQLRASNLELEASNRELESFSYSVSHDLRAPLRGIDGWSLALMEDYGPQLDKTAADYIGRVRRESQRLGQIIDELLRLSRTTRAELHVGAVDLSALAAATGQRVAESWPDTTVEFVCQPGLQAVGDATLLEAALYNLLDNAWKFSSKAPRPRVEFGCGETERGPAFFVRDNGAGFEMRHARKLFGAFQRMHTQEEFPGTGVGLAIVQRIVRRHGGQIWADASPGVGATFFFTLPGVPASRSQDQADGKPGGSDEPS